MKLSLKDAIFYLIFSSCSPIEVYYTNDMGVFMTTIFDGENNTQKQQEIINKSILLPNVDEIVKKYNTSEDVFENEKIENSIKELLVEFCSKNNIPYE